MSSDPSHNLLPVWSVLSILESTLEALTPSDRAMVRRLLAANVVASDDPASSIPPVV